MGNNNLSDEQIKDIKDRELKALESLKELQLTPAAQMIKVNVGDDIFADRVVPYLQDIKYSGKGIPSTDPSINPRA